MDWLIDALRITPQGSSRGLTMNVPEIRKQNKTEALAEGKKREQRKVEIEGQTRLRKEKKTNDASRCFIPSTGMQYLIPPPSLLDRVIDPIY